MNKFIIILIMISPVVIPIIVITHPFKKKHKRDKDESHKIEITYKQFKTLVDSALTLRDLIKFGNNENLKDLVVHITFCNSLHGLTHVKIDIGTNETVREQLFKIKFLHGLPCKIYATKVMKSENNRVFQNMIDCIQGISNCYISSMLDDVDD